MHRAVWLECIRELRCRGWTEQDSTTGAQLFDASKIPSKTQGGATLTNNGDGSFTITGEGQLTTLFVDRISISGDEARKFLRAGTIRSTNMARKVPEFYVYARDSAGEVLFTTAGNGECELTDEILGAIDGFYYVFYSGQGSVITPGIVWPMVYQDGDGTWEPYTGGAPSPSPDYPQKIVSAGKYNEDTQKWEYEITITNAQTDPDKNQTVLITSDRSLTKWDKLEKRNGQWGWAYKSAEIESYTDESVPGEYYSTTGQLSVGAQVWYETATETFVPLSPEEQEAMNTLHTFRPTTVLSNDCECNMSLTYKTKKSLEVTT